jgi:cytochrome b561
MIMQTLSSRYRYGAIAQGFHWLTATLVMAAYFMGPGVLLRVLWRLIDRVPEDPPMAPWMKYSSKFVHLVLYGLLIATPVTTIVGAWLEGHPLTLLAFGNIGPMLSQSHEIGQSVASIHPILGDAILWVAGLHAAAALYHHFFLRDRVLGSMLPWRQ